MNSSLEQRLVEKMSIEKQCDADTASVVRCLYEQEVHQVSIQERRKFYQLCHFSVYETDYC